MGKEKGVYQLENGYWAYRFVIDRQMQYQEGLITQMQDATNKFAMAFGL